MLGLIRGSFTCCTAEIVIPLYKAFVRQYLEFGVTVWGGIIKRKQLHAIEKLQMRATMIVESVKGMPYEEQLRKLKLPTMTYRRARGLMMEVWKHINWLQTTQPTSGGAVTANSSCCANCVEPHRPQQWGPDLPIFWACGPAGWLALLLTKAGDVETNPGPTTLNKKVWICDICHKQIHVRKQISIRCNRIEYYVFGQEPAVAVHLALWYVRLVCHQYDV